MTTSTKTDSLDVVSDQDNLHHALCASLDYLAAAKDMCAHLETRALDAARRIEQLAADRKTLSYTALSSDNPSLKARLDDLNKASVMAELVDRR